MLEYVGDLARMMCRVPGAALERPVRRHQAVILGFNSLLTRSVGKSIPPSLEPRNNFISVAGDFIAGRECSVRKRLSDDFFQKLRVAGDRFQIRLADAEDMVAQQPDRPAFLMRLIKIHP